MLKSLFVLAVFSTLLEGCSYHPTLLSASAQASGPGKVMISAMISRADADYIRKRGLFFDITLFDCDNENNSYPIDAFVNGKRSPHYDLPSSQIMTEVSGTVPKKIFERLGKRCLKIRGGNFFGMKVYSNKVAVVTR